MLSVDDFGGWKMDIQDVAQKLLTAKTLGEALSLSKRQIFRLNSAGKIPGPVRIGGAVRWRQGDVEHWISLGCPDRKTFEVINQAEGK
jgi:predicted DNA-binding transcriptional regulator AlpA